VRIAALLLIAPLVAAAADDELLAVGPAELPKVWTLDRDSWTIASTAIDGNAQTGCVAVSFVIEPSGATDSFKVLRSVPEDAFEDAARRLVKSLRYEPTALNAKREAVFTYMTITFNARRERTLGSNIRQPVTLDERVNKLCAVQGFDF
jgi:TonB family protein